MGKDAENPQFALQKHANSLRQTSLNDLLCGEGSLPRAKALQLSFHSLQVDFSKQRLTENTLDLLKQWADSCGLAQKRDALFAGEPVNVSENQAALHMAARWPSDAVAPEGMAPTVSLCGQQRAKLAELVRQVHSGEWRGVTGEAFTDVVHIGVGGGRTSAPNWSARCWATPRAGGLSGRIMCPPWTVPSYCR